MLSEKDVVVDVGGILHVLATANGEPVLVHPDGREQDACRDSRDSTRRHDQA